MTSRGRSRQLSLQFHDFEQIGGFEVASAENSGTTDSGVSDEGRSIPPIYLHIWSVGVSAGSPTSKG